MLDQPYQNTRIPPEESVQQIEGLLRKYGIAQWNWTIDHQNRRLAITFTWEVRNKKRVIRRVPPIFVKKDYTHWPATYRCLFYSLKSRIESVAQGCDVDQEFGMDIVILDKAKQQAWTVGQSFSVDMYAGKITPLTSGSARFALPVNQIVEVAQ